MLTESEIQKEFKTELKTLLKKYNASIEINDEITDSNIMPYKSSDKTIMVDIVSEFDITGNLIKPGCYFSVGNYLD